MGNLVTLEDARAARAADAEAQTTGAEQLDAEIAAADAPADTVESQTGQLALATVRGMGGKRPTVEAVSLKGASAKLPKMLSIPKGSTVTMTVQGVVTAAGEADKLDKDGFIEQTIRQVVIDCDELLVLDVTDGDGNVLVEGGLRVRMDAEPDDETEAAEPAPADVSPAEGEGDEIEITDVEVIEEIEPAAATPAFFCDKATGEVVGTNRDEIRAWLDTQAVENAEGLDELLGLNAELIAARIREGQSKLEVAVELIVGDLFDWGALEVDGESAAADAEPAPEPTPPVEPANAGESDTAGAEFTIEHRGETYTTVAELAKLKKYDLTAIYQTVLDQRAPSSLSTKPKLVEAIVEYLAQQADGEAGDVSPEPAPAEVDPQVAAEAGDPPAPADDDDPFAPVVPSADVLGGMQRSQLVQLANQLDVATASTDTKAEVIAAIEATR